ncbi:hypothetical protein QQ045_008387 [Rhodiola kirilowii]
MDFFALKLDMSKAYDKVEWEFLELMMLKLGFPERWVKCVMAAVMSVSYRVRVNDMMTEEIWPERGIRQDNSMIFLKATMKNASNLKEILRQYESISGQVIIFEKSEIFFSKNVPDEVRSSKSNMLGVRQVDQVSKYLGLPISFSHNRMKLFRFVIEKVWKKVQGWKEKTLSMAGKEVLIKAVIQAIPMYAMMCYKLPDSLVRRIVSIVSKFWWSNNKDGKGVHLCIYDKLCRSKIDGGLGFRDMRIFNEALLAKHAWRLLVCENSLVSRLLKAKYYSNSIVLNCQLAERPSLAWRSIWAVGRKMHKWINMDDRRKGLVWKLESSGIFTSRSAYIKFKEEEDRKIKDRIGEQSDGRRLKGFWKIIWRLKVQPKVKIFA